MIFDAHLDLSLNAIEWNRDLRKSVEEVRKSESHLDDLQGRGNGTVTFPSMREGDIGICVATQQAVRMKPAAPVGSFNPYDFLGMNPLIWDVVGSAILIIFLLFIIDRKVSDIKEPLFR